MRIKLSVLFALLLTIFLMGAFIKSTNAEEVITNEEPVVTDETTTTDADQAETEEDIKAKLEEAYLTIKENVKEITRQKDEIKKTQTYQTIILVVGIFAVALELFVLIKRRIAPKIKEMTASSKSIDDNTSTLLSHNLEVANLSTRVNRLLDEITAKNNELERVFNESRVEYQVGIDEVKKITNSFKDIKESIKLIACRDKACVEEGIAEEICSNLGE